MLIPKTGQENCSTEANNNIAGPPMLCISRILTVMQVQHGTADDAPEHNPTRDGRRSPWHQGSENLHIEWQIEKVVFSHGSAEEASRKAPHAKHRIERSFFELKHLHNINL